MRKAPRRGLRLAKFQFLLFLLVCFLLPDVIALRQRIMSFFDSLWAVLSS